MKIGVIGSPGSGKTTLCSGLFYKLKTEGVNVEIVPELIKYKVYQGENFLEDGFDIKNTLEQKSFENIFDKAKKNGKIDVIICESPLCNGYFYSSFYNKKLEKKILKKIALESINNYDVILFVKSLTYSRYIEFGRKETKSQAKKLEEYIKKEIKNLNFKNKIYEVTQQTNIDEILSLIKK